MVAMPLVERDDCRHNLNRCLNSGINPPSVWPVPCSGVDPQSKHSGTIKNQEQLMLPQHVLNLTVVHEDNITKVHSLSSHLIES